MRSIIGTITAASIVRVMIAIREHWASLANYVEYILRLKKTDFKAAEYVGAPAQIILAHISNEIRNRELDKRNCGNI